MTIKTHRVGPSLSVQVELQGKIINLGALDKAYVETFSMQLKDAHEHLEKCIAEMRRTP